tara:strand:- start:787 stop:1011 length:225 start_codon:yes stop_codon:yes gene_type:complete
MPRKKAYKYKDTKEFPIEVGDWVLPTNLSVGKFEPAYQVEEIDDTQKNTLYHIVQTEGCYQHRMKLPEKKIRKL